MKGSKLGFFSKFSESLDSNKTSFLSLGLENEGLSFFPNFDNIGLTWEDMGSESGRVLWKSFRVTVAELLIDDSSRESWWAETMDNWSIETSHSSHIWINMKRVQISIESVEKSLVRVALCLSDYIRSSLRNIGILDSMDTPFISVSTNTSDHKWSEDSDK